jgi:hypothetical protein
VPEVPEKPHFSRGSSDTQATKAVAGHLIHSGAVHGILVGPLDRNATTVLNCLGSRATPNAVARSSARSTFVSRAHGKPCPSTGERSSRKGPDLHQA